MNRGSGKVISHERVNSPLPAGLSAGSGGTTLAVVGAEDTPGIFASNLNTGLELDF
jgi:hypothetical protein